MLPFIVSENMPRLLAVTLLEANQGSAPYGPLPVGRKSKNAIETNPRETKINTTIAEQIGKIKSKIDSRDANYVCNGGTEYHLTNEASSSARSSNPSVVRKPSLIGLRQQTDELYSTKKFNITRKFQTFQPQIQSSLRFQNPHDEKISDRDFFKMGKQDFRDCSFRIGPAIRLVDFAE
ncbi:16209_t:CDS:2, partial [Acaulospora colombiana]